LNWPTGHVLAASTHQFPVSSRIWAPVTHTSMSGPSALSTARLVPKTRGASMLSAGRGGKVPGMKAPAHLLALLALPACGGRVVGKSGDSESSGPSTDAGITTSTDAGVARLDAGTAGSGSGGTDASVSPPPGEHDAGCQLQPPSSPGHGGNCVYCNDEWYCPSPQPPAPECAPGVKISGHCTASCVQCADGSASYYACFGPAGMGLYGPFLNEFSCSM
jgi:hypothetical protein